MDIEITSDNDFTVCIFLQDFRNGIGKGVEAIKRNLPSLIGASIEKTEMEDLSLIHI